MIEYGCLVVLLILSVWDIKEKKVPVWILWVFTLGSIPLFLQKTVIQKLYAMVVWGVLGLIGFWTVRKREWIGRADLWIMGACAAAFSVDVFNKGIFTTALLGAGISGVLFIKNRDRTQRIPFIPFIFGGIVIWYLQERIKGIG